MSDAGKDTRTTAALFQKCTDAIASATRLARESRAIYLERHGSPDQLFASLKLELIDSPGDANLSRFYWLYETIFTLPEERESFEGFEQVFGFNRDTRLLKRFGFFHESAICASDPASGQLVAAVSVVTYEMPMAVRAATGVDGTGHVVYLFVRPDFRMLGIASRLMRVMKRYCNNLLLGRRGMDALMSPAGVEKKIYYLCEQNAPEKMTAAEYLADGTHAGIDQCDRLVWWLDQGYRRLDFRYVQPPLDAATGPCTNLTLNAEVEPDRQSLPSALVQAHLERFFSISVLKGSDATADATYSAMIGELSSSAAIGLYGTRDYYGVLKREIHALVARPDADDVLQHRLLGDMIGSGGRL